MEETIKIMEWIRSLPDNEKDKMKNILFELNEIRETNPKSYVPTILEELIKRRYERSHYLW